MSEFPEVLLLNASYEALRTVQWRAAVMMLVRGKARVHSTRTPAVVIRSAHLSIELPEVIVLEQYVYVPHYEIDEHSPATMAGVLRRDSNMCGYCGDFAATVDHIHPRSRGGPNTWANLIAACSTCNQLKADMTPEEAGLSLLWPPRVPIPAHAKAQKQIWRQVAAA